MIHRNHKVLVAYSTSMFALLSMLVAVLPAIQINKDFPPASVEQSYTELEQRGRDLYLAEGCATCHTQFVRNLAVDRNYGRGSIAKDYAKESPPLLGTQRTGPDLANVGIRQPSETWNLIHLYNPRAVVPTSVMPSYPWYFKEIDADSGRADVVPVPSSFLPESKAVVASKDAIALVRYLQTLKQAEIK